MLKCYLKLKAASWVRLWVRHVFSKNLEDF